MSRGFLHVLMKPSLADTDLNKNISQHQVIDGGIVFEGRNIWVSSRYIQRDCANAARAGQIILLFSDFSYLLPSGSEIMQPYQLANKLYRLVGYCLRMLVIVY